MKGWKIKLVIAAAVAVALLVAGLCGYIWLLKRGLREAETDRDIAKLSNANIATAKIESERTLREEAEKLSSKNEVLQSELDKMRETVDIQEQLIARHRITGIRLSTKKAELSVRPDPEPPAPSNSLAGGSPTPIETEACAICPDTLDPESDIVIDVETTVVAVRATSSATAAVTGTTKVIQTYPPPAKVVVNQAWTEENTEVIATEAITEGEAEPVPWLLGPTFGYLSGKPAIGGLAMGPAWTPKLFKWEPEVRPFVLVMGSEDDWLVAAGVAAGW